ncbi:MAG TPA: FHA domain-containing protein [Miltoncostaeaceae bacterium]|nr:FHA domain-containing protein [Miltoncostaeaceae bacterium]
MYCPECGFHQSEAHNYCERCGALLHVEGKVGDTTGPFAIGDAEADSGVWSGGVAVEGPTLAVRSGGGPTGEIFPVGRWVTIGRSPDSDIFLDDVTVSRNHAVVFRNDDTVVLKDLGSLNGTYVNRRRIEEDEVLADGDELQIGKFRLTFIAG